MFPTRRRSLLKLVAAPAALSATLVDVGRLAVPSTLPHLASPASSLSPVPRVAAMDAGEASLPAGRLAIVLAGILWYVRPDASRLRLATGTGGWLQNPVWSPDGSTLAYSHLQWRITTAPAPPGSIPWPFADVYGVTPDGPDRSPFLLVRRDPPDESLVSPTWSADGSYLYAVRRRPLAAGSLDVLADVVRVTLATGSLDVIPTDGEAVELAAAPDGALAIVAVTSATTGIPDVALRLLSPSGDHHTVVSTQDVPELGFITFPRFSPDGRYLLFAAGGGDLTAGTAGAPLSARTLGDPASARTLGAPTAAYTLDSPASARALGALMSASTAASPTTLPPPTLGAGLIRTAFAHGPRAWPWIADLESGALYRVPTAPLDDLAGLGWLADSTRLLILDANGFAIVDVAAATLHRLTPLETLLATAFAWLPAAPSPTEP